MGRSKKHGVHVTDMNGMKTETEIRVYREDDEFFATIEGKEVRSHSVKDLKKLIDREVKETLNLEWIPVVVMKMDGYGRGSALAIKFQAIHQGKYFYRSGEIGEDGKPEMNTSGFVDRAGYKENVIPYTPERYEAMVIITDNYRKMCDSAEAFERGMNVEMVDHVVAGEVNVSAEFIIPTGEVPGMEEKIKKAAVFSNDGEELD